MRATTSRFTRTPTTSTPPKAARTSAASRSALTKAVNQYAKTNNLLKEKDPSLTGDDLREGLTAVISVKVPNPQFEGQTKTKLGNGEVEGIVNSIVYKASRLF